MKLTIKRDQADVKGVFGNHKGVTFSLYARAEITEDERALIDRYKVGDHILARYEVPVEQGRTIEVKLTVNRITKGDTQKMEDIAKLLELEKNIKNGCATLKSFLEVMKTFGGEEVVDI